jgi:hypothetical protein
MPVAIYECRGILIFAISKRIKVAIVDFTRMKRRETVSQSF